MNKLKQNLFNFQQETSCPFFTLWKMGLHQFHFCPWWNEALMLEDPVTSSGKQDDCGSIFSADTSDPLQARYCSLWNEKYYYIPRTSENSKYSNTSNTKSQLEMHINICGGLTPNWEQGIAAGWGKWKPGSDLAS